VSQKRFVSRHRVYSAAGILVLVLCAWGVGVPGGAVSTGGSRASSVTSVLLQDDTSGFCRELFCPGLVNAQIYACHVEGHSGEAVLRVQEKSGPR